MSDMLLIGLRSLFGNDVVDYPGSWHLYNDQIKIRNFDKNLLWGKGFTTQGILDNYNEIDRSDIHFKIKKKYFDLIIFSSCRRSKKFLEEVIKFDNKFIFIDGEDDVRLDLDLIGKSIYFKRELIKIKKGILPINFAIPKEKISKKINTNPTNLLAPLIPGKSNTYIYNDEDNYYEMYQNSIFGLTFKKEGWDCLRHYEILMNGCLPLFLDIENCPNTIMTNFPKKDVSSIQKKYSYLLSFYNNFDLYPKKNRKIYFAINFIKSLFKKKIYKDEFLKHNPNILDQKEKLLEYTKKNLTTEKLAEYVINEIKK